MERVTTSAASQDYIDTGHMTFVMRDEDRVAIDNALKLATDTYLRHATVCEEALFFTLADQFTLQAAQAANMRAILAGERDF